MRIGAAGIETLGQRNEIAAAQQPLDAYPRIAGEHPLLVKSLIGAVVQQEAAEVGIGTGAEHGGRKAHGKRSQVTLVRAQRIVAPIADEGKRRNADAYRLSQRWNLT